MRGCCAEESCKLIGGFKRANTLRHLSRPLNTSILSSTSASLSQHKKLHRQSQNARHINCRSHARARCKPCGAVCVRCGQSSTGDSKEL
jgi:hypothetical protein